MKKEKSILMFVIVLLVCVSMVSAGESEATRLLKARTYELREDVIKVCDDVYCAVGYSPANVSMIVGTDGIIIVDAGMTVNHAARILAEFRKITDKPIKAVILTHDHGDHTGGLSEFLKDGSPQVWVRSNYGKESSSFKQVGLTFNAIRGARQGGFKLPSEKRINNGIAPAMYPKRKGNVFYPEGSDKAGPTHTFSEDRKTMKIAGVEMELVAATGETYDHLYVWLPEKHVLFSGDNFYQSWPNLYTIRGTQYRDIRVWAESNDKMLKENADILIPGHTRPIIGKESVATVLTDYRDAINFIFDTTIEGMNKGLTPDELVDYVQLPKRFTEKDYLRPYYGHPEWAVRAVFTAHFGWFDGNPTNLFSLSVREEAQRMAELVGGREILLNKTKSALARKDYQWTAQLADYLIALNPDAPEPKFIKAQALEGLGENLLTATGRNYYLTVAQELRQAAGQ